MQEVSAKWIENQNENFVPLSYVKIDYDSRDKEIENKGFTSNSFTTHAFGDINWEDTTQEVGINNYFFAPYPTYTIYFNQTINTSNSKLSFVFDEGRGEYPFNFDVIVSNTADVSIYEEKSYYNTGVNRTVPIGITGFNKIEVVFKNWNSMRAENVYAHIDSLYFVETQSFVKEDIMSLSASQTVDLLSFSLPKSSLSFELNNSDDRYNPDNPMGIYKELNNREELKVSFGYENGDDIEWIPSGVYFLNDWNTPQNGITATFSARDGIEYMNEKFDEDLFDIGSPYTPVEYIQSSNGYIDTRFVPQKDNFYSMFLSITPYSTSNTRIWGNNDNTSSLYLEIYNNKYRINFNGHYSDITTVTLYERTTIYIGFWIDSSYENSGSVLCTLYDSQGNQIATSGLINGVDGDFANLPMYLSAIDHNGTPENIANLQIQSFKIMGCPIGVEEEEIITSAFASYRVSDGVNGCYSSITDTFYPGIGTYTKGNDLFTSKTLYDLAISAFSQSSIPTNTNNTNRFEQFLSDELKKYPVTIPNNFSHTNAEVVQLCCNAAKCVWYWDRNGQSHIEPFDISLPQLPSNLTRVDCAEVRYNGSWQTAGYFDTEIYPTDDTVIRIKFNMKAPTGDVIIGYKTNSEADSFKVFNYGNVAYLDYGSGEGGNRISGGTINNNTIYNLEIGNRYVKNIDTGEYLCSANAVTFPQKTSTIKVFYTQQTQGKVYEVEILQGGIPVRHLVPVHDKTENYTDSVNLYDYISDSLMTKVGTAYFNAELLEYDESFEPAYLPNGYTQVSYVESDGSQTLNTGIIPNNTNSCQIEDDYEITDTNLNLGCSMFKQQTNGLNYYSYSNETYFALSNGREFIKEITEPSGRHKIKFDIDSGGMFEYSGDYEGNSFNSVSISNEPITLFNGKKQRVYRFKYSQNNIVVNDLVPCIRNSDSVVGLYDTIRKLFLTTSGLIAGGAKTKADYEINRFNSYQNGEYEISKELSQVDVNNGQAIYKVSNKGETQTVNNPLIQNTLQAQSVAMWVANILKMRKTVSGDYRADVRLDALDKVTVENKFATLPTYITEETFTYAGSFKGKYKGKVKE